ncbi:MAG: hypothetical protein WBK55_04325 [Alphaproteobacteria bacterium]
MSEYAERYIRDALKMSKGNNVKATKQVLEWALEDERLMRALVGPNLKSIVAYNVERVASGRSEKAKSLEPLARKIKGKNSQEKFGMELLKAVVDDHATVFGFEDQPARRKSASQDHIEAIKKLANTRSKSKKDK